MQNVAKVDIFNRGDDAVALTQEVNYYIANECLLLTTYCKDKPEFNLLDFIVKTSSPPALLVLILFT